MRGAAGQLGRERGVRPLGHDQGQPTGPERRGQDVGRRVELPDLVRLAMVGEEQDDRPCRAGAAWPRTAARDRRRAERDAEPVDRVGRHRHEEHPDAGRRSPPARPAASSGRTPGRHRRRPAAPAGREQLDVPRRRPAGEDERLDDLGGALVLDRRGDVARGGPDGRRRRRHRHAVARQRDHLEVVVLVAHRQGLLERDPEPPGQPADRPALRDARGQELEELRVADGHLGPPGEVGPRGRRGTASGAPTSPTARTFETGWRIQRSRSGTISARAPRNAE